MSRGAVFLAVLILFLGVAIYAGGVTGHGLDIWRAVFPGSSTQARTAAGQARTVKG